jgi:hypothetical protein
MGVEWALTQTQDVLAAGSQLVELPDWALIYWDELNEVLLRRDVPQLRDTMSALEYRYFHPLRVRPQTLVADIAPLSRPELSRYLSEVDRFLTSTPDNRFAHLVRCLLTTRLYSEVSAGACERARMAAQGDRAFLELVEEASRMPPLR